jgi:oxygen-independent coproporphyrinogen III oxidase
MHKKTPLSLYIHIPFCKTRCGYCDFNTYAGKDHWIPEYMKAVVGEIIQYSKNLHEDFSIHTIYFGGGTPSIIPAEYFREVFRVIRRHFEVVDQPEVTLEANPNGLSKDYLNAISDIGINRLSIGMQSAVPNELDILDRKHTMEDVQNAVVHARACGIANLNLDLIFSIPSQTMRSLHQSVNRAIELAPTHLSIYGLILHEETALFQKIESGVYEAVDEDLAGDMYAWLMDYLPTRGFRQYEISNWADAEGSHSRHNLQYWHNLEYLGIGAGAHSHLKGYRWSNLLGIQPYILGVKESEEDVVFLPCVDEKQKLLQSDMVKETMMMGLRLTKEGVNINSINTRFDVDICGIYSQEIKKLSGHALIELMEIEGELHLRLTEKGRMLGNQVFMEFI